MWALTREGLATLRQQGVISRWEEGTDRYHLLERLGRAVRSDLAERCRTLAAADRMERRLDAQDSDRLIWPFAVALTNS
jgi:hypothetical protein